MEDKCYNSPQAMASWDSELPKLAVPILLPSAPATPREGWSGKATDTAGSTVRQSLEEQNLNLREVRWDQVALWEDGAPETSPELRGDAPPQASEARCGAWSKCPRHALSTLPAKLPFRLVRVPQAPPALGLFCMAPLGAAFLESLTEQ